jgi:hypothetical protein
MGKNNFNKRISIMNMNKRKSRCGSSVSYKQDNDYTTNNDWDSDINISRFDDGTFDIAITVNNKKQILKRLSETDITHLCRQILHINLSEDWRCKCDQRYEMKKYSDDYFKKHGVYPVVRG